MAMTVMNLTPLVPGPPPSYALGTWQTPDHFVMNGGKENLSDLKQLQQSAPAARARKERPCDGCRKRKSKCVLQDSGRCVLCQFHRQNCTFVENAPPRKRKVDEGSRGDLSNSAKKTASNARTNNNSPFSPLPSTTSDGPTPSAVRPRSQHVPRPNGLAVDGSLGLQRDRHCKYIGQTTPVDASIISLGSFDSRHESDGHVGSIRKVAGTEYFSTHADSDFLVDETRALDDIEATVGSCGPPLIDLYFRYVHASYPIIQKEAFLNRYGQGDRQFDPSLLAAMYMLALPWCESSAELKRQPLPSMTRLEDLAMSSLMMSMQRPKICVIQAGLLLLQREELRTWALTVQLVALGQDLGLHVDCSDWLIPAWERRLRKRIAWALYMQDKWSALMHGRPSHINAADWAVPPPSEDDFNDSIAPPEGIVDYDDVQNDSQMVKGRTLFMQMVSLTSIMAEVCTAFYSQSATAEFARAGAHATKLVLNRAKPVQLRLKDWFAKLPPECKIETNAFANGASGSSSTMSPSSFNPDPSTGSGASPGSLHLAYFATEISIHRRIVQSLTSTSSAAEGTDPYMLYICRSAAKTRLISAMDFVNRLTPAHLQAFWFFSSPTNLATIGTFGGLLQATSPGAEETEFYAARLREFRWTLNVSLSRAGWVKRAVELVDASVGMLASLGEKPRTGSRQGSAGGPVLTTENFNGFAGGVTSGERSSQGSIKDDEAEEEEALEVDGLR